MIFRYPGGKSKKSVRQKILAHFPDNYSEFRDAMVGGGGIFFAIPTTVKRWINDLDPHLISLYQALNERPDEFIALCREIPPPQDGEPLASTKPGGKLLYNARLKGVFEDFADNEECDQALRYFFVHRTVWAGRVNYDIPSRMYFSNPNGWKTAHSSKMEAAAEILQDVKVTCGDYKRLIEEEGQDVLVYLDPPYFKNTELAQNSRLYKFNFEVEDHERMAKLVKKCKHRVVISYDDHSYIRELYKDFNQNKAEWKYCGTSSAEDQGQNGRTKEAGKELIITNYE